MRRRNKTTNIYREIIARGSELTNFKGVMKCMSEMNNTQENDNYLNRSMVTYLVEYNTNTSIV